MVILWRPSHSQTPRPQPTQDFYGSSVRAARNRVVTDIRLLGKDLTMQATKELRQTLRHPFAWPGGYDLAIYLSDGERICHKCARENYRQIISSTRNKEQDGWAFGKVSVHWEGPPEFCVQCGDEQESEYGDPDNSERI